MLTVNAAWSVIPQQNVVVLRKVFHRCARFVRCLFEWAASMYGMTIQIWYDQAHL